MAEIITMITSSMYCGVIGRWALVTINVPDHARPVSAEPSTMSQNNCRG